MDWIKKMSLRKALVTYIVAAVLIVVLCYVCTYSILQNWILMVREKYALDWKSYFWGYEYNMGAATKEEKGWNIIWLLDRSQRFCMVPYMFAACIVVTQVYFNNKLREPLRILRQEALCIAREDFEFSCSYEGNDEMSEICDTFEKMRLQLMKNQNNRMELMEDQRNLNAAFAHDLRTPLTVMSGYVEMLASFDMADATNADMQLDMLRSIQKQIDRLQDFSNTMYKLQSFEMQKTVKRRNELSCLLEQMQENILGLDHKVDLRIQWKDCLAGNMRCFYDERMILEVLDNLLSNAMRYAKDMIEVSLRIEGGVLQLYVKDNGRGFSGQDMEKAARPYYTEESKEDHFGLGLSICKTLCKKHGGYLEFFNSIHGGAIVCASFYVL